MSIENKIVQVIENAPKDGLTGAEIWMKLGWWRIFGVYPALMRLERSGRLRGAWVNGPYPRKRLYHLVRAGTCTRKGD